MADRRRRRNLASESDTDTSTTAEEIAPKAEGIPQESVESQGEITDEDKEAEDAGSGDDAYNEEDGSNSNEDGSEEEEDDDDEDEEDEEEEEPEEGTEGGEVEGDEAESDTDEADGEQRQSGDGQEQNDAAVVLDDDEDTKNPAYIPRKGAFYEHDMRIEGDTEAAGGEKVLGQKINAIDRPRKKLWSDADKWMHDKYDDTQQRPKSRDELISIYGYDIREHDVPPDDVGVNNRMRRGRGFGPRGRRPNRLGDFIQDKSRPYRSQGQDQEGDDEQDRSVDREQYSRPQSWQRRDRGGDRGSNRDGSSRSYRGWHNDKPKPRAAVTFENSNTYVRAASQEDSAKERLVNGAQPAGPFVSKAEASAQQSGAVRPGPSGDVTAAASVPPPVAAASVPPSVVAAASMPPAAAAASVPPSVAQPAQQRDDTSARTARVEAPSGKARNEHPLQQNRDVRQPGVGQRPIADRPLGAGSNDAATSKGVQQQHAKPKRYSSQRQRALSPVQQTSRSADAPLSAGPPAPVVSREFYPAQHHHTVVPHQQQLAVAASAALGYVQHASPGISSMPTTATQQVLAPNAVMHNAQPMHYPGSLPMGHMQHLGTPPRLLFAHGPVAGLPPGAGDQVLSGPRLAQPAQYLTASQTSGMMTPAGAMMFNIPAQATHSSPSNVAPGAPVYMMPAGPLGVQYTSPGARAQMMPSSQTGPEGYNLGGTVYYNPAGVMGQPDVLGPGPQYYGDGMAAVPPHSNIVYYMPAAQPANRTPPRRQKSAIPIVHPEDVSVPQAGSEGLAAAAPDGAERLGLPIAATFGAYTNESTHAGGESGYLIQASSGCKPIAPQHDAVMSVPGAYNDQSGRPPDISHVEARISAISFGSVEDVPPHNEGLAEPAS